MACGGPEINSNTETAMSNNILPPTCSIHRILILAACLCLAGTLTGATTTSTWTGGGGGNLSWGNSANWSGGALNGENIVLFTNTAVTGTIGPSGTPNSVVDSEQIIQGLYLQYTNTDAALGHTIQLNSGVSLSITGSAPTAVIVGTWSTGVADRLPKDGTNYSTILGGGSLVINSSGNFIVRGQSENATAGDGKHSATLDMSGLNNFSATISGLQIGTGNQSVGLLKFAKTNTIVSAGSVQLANATGQPGVGSLFLGQTNALFFSGGFSVGDTKATAWVGFNTNLASQPVALFRDRYGTGRQSSWLIGDHGGATTSAGCKGTMDLSYGTVDAMVDTAYVGRGQTGVASGAGQGWLIFTNGTIDVNNLNIGYQRADNSSGKGWVYLDGGAQLVVNNNLYLGRSLGILRPPVGVLCLGTNVPGGSAWVKGDILEGGLLGTADATNDLVYVNGGSLKVSGTVGATNALQNMALTNAILTFDRGKNGNPSAPLWRVTKLKLNNVTANVEGSGFTVGQFSLIKYGTVDGDLNTVALGSLPPHVNGYLSNYTANSSIDLVITDVVALKWNGATNSTPIGNWDVGLTANWLTSGGSVPTVFAQDDQISFDDSATGTTTVDLTTVLIPSNLIVSNSSKDYTFEGSGSLSGVTALTKNGSRPLTLSNTGTNDFSGAVTINGGAVVLSGSADRLPTNAAVTLANVADAALNLNGLNQSIGSLSGGGGAGGNVALGAGTLTLRGAGTYAGVIDGAGAVVKSGSGTQIFSAGNTYNGGTTISGGVLQISNPDGSSGLGSGSVVVQAGATLRIGEGVANGSFTATTITNNGSVVLNRSDNFAWTKFITGTGSFTKSGANTITISTANDYSGGTYITAGVVRIDNPGALGTTGLISISNPDSARLELTGGITLQKPITISMKGGGSVAPAIVNVSGTNTLTGLITLAAGGSRWIVASDSDELVILGNWTSTVTGAGDSLWLQGSGNGIVRGNIVGNADHTVALHKVGSGTWTLSGTNTLTGNTFVDEGTLILNGAMLGTASIAVGSTSVGTLTGTGLLNAPISITGYGVLCGNSVTSSGTASGAPVGGLIISNSLTLLGSAAVIVGVSPAGCDSFKGISSLSLSGTLKVVVTNGRLVGGEVFKLFNATLYDGTDFYSYDLPDLGASELSWDTSTMKTDGTLRVLGSVVPQVLSITSAGPGSFAFSGTGPTNWPYSIVAATNVTDALSNWVQVSTGTFVNGAFTFSDPNAALYPRRYYQVRAQFP